MQIKSHEDIRDFIIHLEQKFPVDNWKINSIHIWPYLRIKLFIYLIKSIENNASSFDSKLKKEKINNRQKKDILKRLFNIIKTLFFLIKIPKAKIIFFSLDMHRVFYNGLYFNRFFDVMVQEHGLQDEVITYELKNISKPVYNADRVIHLPTILKGYKDFLKIKKKLSIRPKKVLESEIGELDDFLNYLTINGIDIFILNFNLKSLYAWSEKIKEISCFFIRVFNYKELKKIFFLSNQGFDDMSAAIYAAQKLNIPTIEFQHGFQTNVHMGYAHWTKVPVGGFNTMPLEYWCWDKHSQSAISQWSTHTYIKSIVKGQPWLTFFTKKNMKSLPDKKKILYSLHLFSEIELAEVFPPQLIHSINNLPFDWTLRLHPRNSLEINKISVFLAQNNIDLKKIDIQDPKKIPLPLSLLSSKIHITNYSGCLIEAIQMGVPSLIIDKLGQMIYKNYIEGNMVVYKNKFDSDFNYFLKEYVKDEKENSFHLYDIPNPIA